MILAFVLSADSFQNQIQQYQQNDIQFGSGSGPILYRTGSVPYITATYI